ncbi:MAG: tandem-95 repeat protein [Bacteroidota bacterium]
MTTLTRKKSLLLLLTYTTISLFFASSGYAQNVAPSQGNEYLSIDEDQTPALIGNLLLNNIDPNGDAVSISNIYSSVAGAFITNLNNGFIDYETLLNHCGIDTIRYFVTDGNFFVQDTLFLTINCINDLPTGGDETLTVLEDASATTTVDLLANNADAEGDILTISGIGTPTNGTLTSNGDGTYDYTPNPNYCGTEIIAYQVTDGVNTITDFLTITVTCVNDAPIGGNETMTINEDSGSNNSGYLLGNDSDPEGNTLTILTVTQTGGGIVTLTGTGSVDYTPNPNFCGNDTVVYSVTDGVNVIFDTLFITVICINDLPLGGNEWVVTDTNTVLSNIDILANNSDIETNPLTVSSPSFPATTTMGGTVTMNGDGTVNYTPPTDYEGADTLVYTVCDDWMPTAACVTDTLFIMVSSDMDDDGVIDADDIDADNDGISNATELLTALNNGDTDNDGTPDIYDLDSDNDGISDIIEAGGVDTDGNGMVDNQFDWNNNGMDDDHELNPLPLSNTDGDAQPNFQDVDDDGDSTLTIDEYDENMDGIVDDCNGNGTSDYLDAETCTVIVPEIFSPNWDGKNDVLFITGIFAYPGNTFTVYNRWGQPVLKATDYQNNWSGKNEVETWLPDTTLPVGTYFYVLDLNDGSAPMKGYIYLTR